MSVTRDELNDELLTLTDEADAAYVVLLELQESLADLQLQVEEANAVWWKYLHQCSDIEEQLEELI